MRTVIVCLSLGVLNACGDPPPQIPALAPNAVILAFGNSLTYGTGAQRNESYPALLASLTGRRVINGGVPGELSQDGAMRLPRLLDQHKPALLILCHGGNDLLRKKPPEQTLNNLRQMLKSARSRGIAAVLVGVPEPGIFLRSAALYDRLAEELALPIDTDSLAEILASPSLKSDQIHPNADGYRLLAERIYQLLLETGAVVDNGTD